MNKKMFENQQSVINIANFNKQLCTRPVHHTALYSLGRKYEATLLCLKTLGKAKSSGGQLRNIQFIHLCTRCDSLAHVLYCKS